MALVIFKIVYENLICRSNLYCRDHSDERSALVSQKTKCLHGVALVCYTNSEPSVHTELSSFGRHLYSLLVCNPYMVIAGGENGFVSGWEMDSIWRLD